MIEDKKYFERCEWCHHSPAMHTLDFWKLCNRCKGLYDKAEEERKKPKKSKPMVVNYD